MVYTANRKERKQMQTGCGDIDDLIFSEQEYHISER